MLPVCQQIHFKLCYIVHNCVVGTSLHQPTFKNSVFLSEKSCSISGTIALCPTRHKRQTWSASIRCGLPSNLEPVASY